MIEPPSPCVVIYTADVWENACPVVRLTGLQEAAGFRVIRGNAEDRIDSGLVKIADYVVIQRDFPRFIDAYDEIVAKAHDERKPIIYELVELLFEVPIEHPAHNNPKYRAARAAALCAVIEADLVTVSTYPLYREIISLNPNTQLLQNYLNDRLWPVAQSRRGTDNKPVVIGYIARGTHLLDLEAGAPALIEVLQHYGSDVSLLIYMPQPTNPLAELPNVEWINKYLEYVSTGGAGVPSWQLPFQSVVVHGENVFLASTNEEWVNALSQLIESAYLRKHIVANARATVQSQWLLSKNAQRLKEVYSLTWDGRALSANTSSIQQAARRFHILHHLLQTELEQAEQKVQTLRVQARAVEKETLLPQRQVEEYRAKQAVLEFQNQGLRSQISNL